MIRVAFTSLAPFISGAERSLQITLRHLPAAGVDPVLIGPTSSKLAPWCESAGIQFLPCPLPFRDKWHPLRWWRGVRTMRSLLRSHRIDLVHSNQMWSYPTVGTAAGELGLPRVCHLRDEVEPAVLHWLCAARPEAAICISRHIARQAEQAWHLPHQPRLATRINPVELPPRPHSHDETRIRTEARTALNLPTNTTIFGFIGQIRETKGVLGFLEALTDLPKERPWLAVVAGRDHDPGAHYEKRCRERAAQPDLVDRVRFLGYLDDSTPFYRAIDLAVVPSREEPMGRIPLEAASHARPSLAFAVGGLPDVIDDGSTGWLVPADDWPALRSHLERFLTHPSKEIGQAARDRVEQIAEPNRYVEWLVLQYKDLLGTTARTA